MWSTTLAGQVGVDVKGTDMAKDSDRLTGPVEGEKTIAGGEDGGGLTTDGKGGYVTGQGTGPVVDGGSTDETGGGSTA